LLRFHKRDALLLQAYRAIEQRAHMLLVGFVARAHLDAQLPTCLTLLNEELIELWTEPRARLLELRELPIGEPELLLGNLGGTLTKLLLEGGAIGVAAARSSLRRCRGTSYDAHRNYREQSSHCQNP
jgi:hypothetical protein